MTVVGLGEDVFIDGYIDRNRALEGDTVVVELVDKSLWKVRKTAQKPEGEEEDEMAVVEEVVEELLDDEQLDNDERIVEDVVVAGDSERSCSVLPL